MSISGDGDDYSNFDESEKDFNEAQEEVDFYAILNIPRNATAEDINKAYKQRSLIFHPDRHIDEDDKREASKIFVLIKRAHETLIDPQLRAIYDTIGIRGVNLQGWQLVSRSLNPENIRKGYEFLKRLKDVELMLQRVHPSSNFIIRASISGLFQPDSIEKFALLGMTITHGIDSALSSMDRIGLNGRLSFNEKGHGGGSAQITYKRILTSSLHLENEFTFGPNSISNGVKFAWSILPDSLFARLPLLVGNILILQPIIQYNPLQGEFEFSLIHAISFPLGFNHQGTIAFNCGTRRFGSLTFTYNRAELNHSKSLFQITISPTPSIRMAYHLRYPEQDNNYAANCTFSMTELTSSLSLDRRLTKYSRIGLQIQISLPKCILQATFRLRTSLNNYEFRLLFCEDRDDIGRAVTGLVLGALVLNASYLLSRRFFPKFAAENVDEEGFEIKKEQAQKIVHLMRETAEKIAREEEHKKGLVIVEANFGQMIDDVPGAELYPVPGEKLINVTIPLQALVNDSQLRIYSGKDQIPGFYDPCPGEPKMLKVIYRFQDRLHSVTVTEDQPLMIPMRAHSIVPLSST